MAATGLQIIDRAVIEEMGGLIAGDAWVIPAQAQ